MAAATARTPRVQLVLNLQADSEPRPREQVLRVTSAHEVVEARHGGVAFQFCRKRKSAAAPPARPLPSATAARSALRTPAAARAASAAVAAESPYADELEVPRAVGRRLLAGLAALPDRAAPTDRLLAICQGLSDAAGEAAAATPRRAAALAAALADFQAALAGALASGGVAVGGAPRPPATPTDDGEVEQPDYSVDLVARKAGLRARLANFQKEEADWHALLQKVEALDQQALAGQQHQEAGAAAGCAAASDAAAAAAAAGGEAAAPTAEEAGLSSVATEPGSYGATPAAATPADDGELAALAAATAGVHRRLAMQIEGVCKLVGDVEELVERANRSAAAVQAEYHAQKFSVFPHVDSPARLIRELVRGPAPAAGPKAEAAAAVAEAGDKETAGSAALGTA